MRWAIRWVVRHPRRVLATWILAATMLAVLAWALAPYLPPDSGDFLPEHSATVQGYRLLHEGFGEEAAESSIVLVFQGKVPFGEAERALAHQLETHLEQLRHEMPHLGLLRWLTWNHPLLGTRLLSADRQCALALIHLNWPFVHDQATHAVSQVETLARDLLQTHNARYSDRPAIQLLVTGTAGFGRDLNVAVYHSLDVTTWATMVLVLALLMLLYRDICVAVVPLVTIGTAVWASLRLLEVLCVCLRQPLINIARIFVVVVLFGAGTDYCLFLISRFREELQRHLPSRAMHITLRQVGGALVASAGVVMLGLAMMAFAEFARVSAVGPYVAIGLGVALAAALTLAPACLLVLARWYGGRSTLSLRKAASDGTRVNWFWHSLAQAIAARPGTILIVSLLIMSPLAWYGATSRAIMDVCAELPPQAESRQGLELIRQHFPAGEIGPATLLLVAPLDTQPNTLRKQVDEITQVVAGLDNVREVRSLTQPLGRSVRAAADRSDIANWSLLSQGVDWLAGQLASRHYLRQLSDKWVARLEIVFGTEPFSAESIATLRQVQQTLTPYVGPGRPFTQLAVHGITSFTADLAQVHQSDRWRVNSLVLLGILAILIAVVRSLGWACYLLATVLFNYFVTLGVVSLIGPLWLGTALGATDWKVPYFLFVILVAVGEDYNIFLMSRVREEQRRLGWCAGIQQALARTGATISMCGLIMAGAFATMMLSELVTLAHLGLALAIGVLLETFVVRPILVPAALLAWHHTKSLFFPPNILLTSPPPAPTKLPSHRPVRQSA
ncbi:Acyltrehalose exporter MmpL10 [bacterium HR36]|nr:Acyltrehalose exporter MmpL10 [bacterium HR36]